MKAKLTQEYQKRESTEESRKAKDLTQQAAKLLMPYGAEHLGSICFHFYNNRILMSGRWEYGFVKQSTELDLSPQALNQMLPMLRDEILRTIGATKMTVRAPTVEEVEEGQENKIKLAESKIIQ